MAKLMVNIYIYFPLISFTYWYIQLDVNGYYKIVNSPYDTCYCRHGADINDSLTYPPEARR